jgi:hypothetical protein
MNKEPPMTQKHDDHVLEDLGHIDKLTLIDWLGDQGFEFVDAEMGTLAVLDRAGLPGAKIVGPHGDARRPSVQVILADLAHELDVDTNEIWHAVQSGWSVARLRYEASQPQESRQ